MPSITLAFSLALLQSPADELRPAQAADSSAEVRSARSAQQAFEWSRARLLPHGGGSTGRCDERVGRFCYWYDDGDTTLPEDPPEVRRARERLLDALDRAWRARPESDWITGQLVRYLVEHGRPANAAEVAGGCRGTTWWCLALAGFALHADERFAQADTAFTRALEAMPRETYCRWTDWSKALEPDLSGRYRPLDCDSRRALADTIFVLSQPLLSRPGNDFRTELMARRVMSVLVAMAKGPQTWSADLDEIGLRYGWPTRWSIGPEATVTLEPPSVIGHDRSPAYAFMPVPVTDSGAGPWRWELAPDRPRNRYGPSYLNRLSAAPAFQIARFPRGDSTVVVAAVDWSADTAFHAPVDLGVAALADFERAPAVSRRDSAGGPAGLVVTLPADPIVVSAEAWTERAKRAIRTRVALTPLDRARPLVLSDLLLFEPGESLPEGLDEAAKRALPGTAFSHRTPVGIYWEASGIEADSLAVSIKVVAFRRGLAGRIAQKLSLVGRRAPLTLQWSAPVDPTRDGAVVGRAFELDLKRLKPGRYRLRLEARTPSGIEAASELPLELRP